MVADLLGSLSFEVSDDRNFAEGPDFGGFGDTTFGDVDAFDNEEPQPVFVRGSVLDACVARDRVERALSNHIAAIDSDDNGLYRLFSNR